MVVGERAQRAECVHLADGLQPVRQFARMDFLPRLDAHNLPQLPEEAAVQHGVHQVIVALVQFVHQLHQPPDGLRGLSAVPPNLVLDGPQERGFHRLIVHRLKQLGVGAQDAELLSVDALHLGNLPREGEAGHYDAEPQHAPYVGWQHARHDTRQAEEVDRRHHVGQPSQQAAVAVADGALRPLQQLGTVGRLPLVQQAQDAEVLAERRLGRQLLHGLLPAEDGFPLVQMAGHPPGQLFTSETGTRAVDVLEERAGTEDVEVVRVGMGRVGKFLAVVEGRGVLVERGQLLAVHLQPFFLIVLPQEQAVVVLHQQQEGQQAGGRHGIHQCVLAPQPYHRRHGSAEQQQAQGAGAVNQSLRLCHFAGRAFGILPVGGAYFVFGHHTCWVLVCAAKV